MISCPHPQLPSSSWVITNSGPKEIGATITLASTQIAVKRLMLSLCVMHVFLRTQPATRIVTAFVACHVLEFPPLKSDV
jgi:hypothetical protein